MKKYSEIGLCLAFLLAITLWAQEGHTTDAESTYYDLGGFHYKVTTDSEDAQLWYDRGLAMCFGFNHEEAVRTRASAPEPRVR